MQRRSFLTVLALCFALASCDSLDSGWVQLTRADCDAGGAVELVIDPAITDRVVVLTADALRISGSARHLCGLTIRQITVDGIVATAATGSFNMSRWEALVPVGVLLARDAMVPDAALGPDEENVRVEASATDAVGVAAAVTTVLRVRRPTGVDVTALAVQLDPVRAWFPSNGSIPALFNVSGGAGASGASVRLTLTPSGAGAVSPTAVVLGGDQATPSAQARLVPTAGAEGPMRVFAVGGTHTAAADVLVAAAPRFAPTSLAIPANATVFFEASSPNGDVVRCGPDGSASGWRFHDVATNAEIGATGVTRAPATTPGVRIAFSVERIDADASPATAVQFSCSDSAGQRGTLSITPRP